MLTNHEKQQQRRWSKIILLIGLFLLLILGGFYWQQRTPDPPKPLVVKEEHPVAVVEKPTPTTPEPVAVAPKLDSAQSLPTELSVSRPAITKRVMTPTKVSRGVNVVAAPVVPKTAPRVEREAVVSVVQHEVAPLTADTRSKAPDLSSSMVQTELKPVVQPIPVPVATVSTPVSTSVPIPITTSATSLPKRKSKNDEDVEIDL